MLGIVIAHMVGMRLCPPVIFMCAIAFSLVMPPLAERLHAFGSPSLSESLEWMRRQSKTNQPPLMEELVATEVQDGHEDSSFFLKGVKV